ncbi:uncharacterized protein LOC108088754 [Drosophila ficusphila]|uniref:uncharacterized protein LOC108088754 n=1 Tax=Drosophila ficusphila TaxID=30025 RepID=UPI0007E8B2EF|nr:uncharacterized protein LOC108088754 [Drosophila ficusphila]
MRKVKYFGHRIMQMQMETESAVQCQEKEAPPLAFPHLSGTHASFACNHDTTVVVVLVLVLVEEEQKEEKTHGVETTQTTESEESLCSSRSPSLDLLLRGVGRQTQTQLSASSCSSGSASFSISSCCSLGEDAVGSVFGGVYTIESWQIFPNARCVESANDAAAYFVNSEWAKGRRTRTRTRTQSRRWCPNECVCSDGCHGHKGDKQLARLS